jgi:multiple antibiotic resistance protein
MKSFWLCFVPLFVAVDAVGILPLFMSLTEGMDFRKFRRIIYQSIITAIAVALVFLVLGSALMNLLGITIADFMVAGGILLFVISLNDVLATEKAQQHTVDPDSLGAVPLGVPLISGPAVLTTSLLLNNQYGFIPTATALVLNILLAGAVFSSSRMIYRFLGKTGAKTVSKITSLLLAAIAVMIIRRGLYSILDIGIVS